MQLWNLIMTGLPPIENAVFDQSVPANVLMILPELYSRGRLGRESGSRGHCCHKCGAVGRTRLASNAASNRFAPTPAEQ